MADPRTTELFSEFNVPPAEDPLYENGNWHKAYVIGGAGDLDMRKYLDGHATDQEHGATLSGIQARSFWVPETFSGDVEVWGYPYGGQLGAALETWRLWMLQDPMNFTSGYLVYIGGGLSKDTVIRRYNSDGSFDVIASDGHGYANGLMIRTIGSDVEVWAVNFGDDPDDPAKWYMRCSTSDMTFRGPFYIGMGVEDPSAGGLSWTNFGGGKPHRTQIYRILPSIG